MLFSLDKIPRLHNILAAFFGWLMLAGFVILPSTFTGLQPLVVSRLIQGSATGTEPLSSVTSLPLLVAASACVVLGAAGLLWLSLRWRRNYVWLLNRLYLPGILNASAGVLSTLANVYGQHNGDWSVSAKMALVVEAAVLTVMGALFILYSNWLLERVKRQHDELVGMFQEKTLRGKVERMANKPPIAPGSVV